jgi:hypothetical protein
VLKVQEKHTEKQHKTKQSDAVNLFHWRNYGNGKERLTIKSEAPDFLSLLLLAKQLQPRK